MGFVKEYNERTAAQVGTIIPVEITIFEDRSFTFVTKTPPAADLHQEGRRRGEGRRHGRHGRSPARSPRRRCARSRRRSSRT